MTEARAGRLELADAYAEQRGLDVRATGRRADRPSALIAAHRGDMERARAFAAEIAARAALHETTLAGPLGIEGLVALQSGDAAAAVELFEAAEGIRHAADDTDPNMAWWRMEHAEAPELGRVDDGLGASTRGATAPLGAGGRSRTRRGAPRSVAAARGEVGKRVALLEAAVTAHESVGDEFDVTRAGRPRCHAPPGRCAPRTRRSTPARATFAAMGAEGRAGEGGRRAGVDRRPQARAGPDRRRATRRRPRRRRPDELRGRCGALPLEADGREPPHAHLREAGRALAHRVLPHARGQSADVLIATCSARA